jgi:hypothetical protein
MSKQKLDRENDVVGIQQATLLPFARWNGKQHSYALTVDIAGLTDVLQPQAKVNFVIDNKIVQRISIQDMIQTFFDL